MHCGKECSVTEVVATDHLGGHLELWCYCEPCGLDTFHPPVNTHEYTEAWT